MFYLSKRNQWQILPCVQSQEFFSLHVPYSLRRLNLSLIFKYVLSNPTDSALMPLGTKSNKQAAVGWWGPALLLSGAVAGGLHAIGLAHSRVPVSKSPSGPPRGRQSGGDRWWADSWEAWAPARTAWFWQSHLTCVTDSPAAKREAVVTPAGLAPLPRCRVRSPHRRALIPEGEMGLSRAAMRSGGKSLAP